MTDPGPIRAGIAEGKMASDPAMQTEVEVSERMSDERLATIVKIVSYKSVRNANGLGSELLAALVAERKRTTALENQCKALCGAEIHAAEAEMERDKLRAEVKRLKETLATERRYASELESLWRERVEDIEERP